MARAVARERPAAQPPVRDTRAGHRVRGAAALRTPDRPGRRPQKTVAVKTAVEKTENENDIEKAIEIDGVKDAAAVHEKRAVKRAVKKERKRAERLAETARNEGYGDGSVAGFSSGHSTGYSEGESEGFEDGMDTASDDLECSDDPDVPLPYFNW